MSRKAEKVVKVCLHSIKTVQVSLQFDEILDRFQNHRKIMEFSNDPDPNLVKPNLTVI